jgi:hypothetical protein
VVKEVPIEKIEKVIYKDSLIYIHDTLQVKIPYEVVKEVKLPIDTSRLKTSFAESIAYVDTAENKLHHTLKQHGNIHVPLDTVVKIQYVDRLVMEEVPVEVEVIKYKRDTLFWALCGWAGFCLVLGLISIAKKL